MPARRRTRVGSSRPRPLGGQRRSAATSAGASSFAGDANDFFGRRDAFGDQPLAVLAHRAQAGRLGGGEDLRLRRRGRGSAPGSSSSTHHQLVDAGAALVAGHAAVRRSRPGASGRARRPRLQTGQSLRTSRCASTPIRLERQQERLDAHVDQPRHRARRVVGVQRSRAPGGRSATPGSRSAPSRSRGSRRS